MLNDVNLHLLGRLGLQQLYPVCPPRRVVCPRVAEGDLVKGE